MLTYSVEDLRTAEGIERVFRQVSTALDLQAQTVKLPDASQLIGVIGPEIRNQLQAGGQFPLNLQSLLPSGVTSGQFIQDTHANRLTLYPAINYPVGTIYYETDRTVYYMVFTGGGVSTWQCIPGGVMRGTLSPDQKPTDLTGNDVRFEFFSIDFSKFYRWTGVAWERRGDQLQAGFIQICSIGPAIGIPGWQLCDGSTVSASRDDGTVDAAITVPDYTGGVYLKVATSTIVGPTASSGQTTDESLNPVTDLFTLDAGGSTAVTAFDDPHHHGPDTLELLHTQLRAYYRR